MRTNYSKFINCILALCLTSMTSVAQDIIFLKTGDEINAKVVKIGAEQIEYKKWSNIDGPSYEVNKKDVFFIKYKNGEKEVFKDISNAENKESVTAGPLLVDMPVDARNAEIIQSYVDCINSVNFLLPEQKNNDAKYAIIFWAIHPGSKISNSNMELEIVPNEEMKTSVWMPAEKFREDVNGLGYYLKLKNKTGETIYIDKLRCYKIDSDGMAANYYSGKVQNVTQGNSSGAAVNLGGVASALTGSGVVGALASGITLGGSSNTTTSTTYYENQIMSIPPYGTDFMEKDNIIEIRSYQIKNLGHHEDFSTSMKRGLIKKYEIKEYTPDTSPCKYQIVVTYSTKQDFSTYSTLELIIYANKVIGQSWNPFAEVTKKGVWLMESSGGRKLIQLPANDLNHLILTGQDLE